MDETPSVRTAITGTVLGLGAFVIGYAVTYLWQGRNIEETIEPIDALLELFAAEPIGTWRAVGWLYYSAHFVDLQIDATWGIVETAITIDMISQGSGQLELLYIVPIVALLVGGLITSYLATPDSLAEGAIAGSTITLGYLLAVVGGLVLFAYNDAAPELLRAIVLAGIAYPLIFGIVGGSIGALLHDPSDSETE